jgi:hypothetical protein
LATSRLLTEEEFTGYLRRLVPLPFKLVASRFLSRYRLHRRVASVFRSGRAFLAGDAAHVHSPVGGQGMNTGIQARGPPIRAPCRPLTSSGCMQVAARDPDEACLGVYRSRLYTYNVHRLYTYNVHRLA